MFGVGRWLEHDAPCALEFMHVLYNIISNCDSGIYVRLFMLQRLESASHLSEGFLLNRAEGL